MLFEQGEASETQCLTTLQQHYTQPGDRSNTFQQAHNLQTTARRPSKNLQTRSTTFKALCTCACAPVRRT
eukprot:14581891-Heterocapsa_arctica.AAC.1